MSEESRRYMLGSLSEYARRAHNESLGKGISPKPRLLELLATDTRATLGGQDWSGQRSSGTIAINVETFLRSGGREAAARLDAAIDEEKRTLERLVGNRKEYLAKP